MWANHNWTNIHPYPYSHAIKGDPGTFRYQ